MPVMSVRACDLRTRISLSAQISFWSGRSWSSMLPPVRGQAGRQDELKLCAKFHGHAIFPVGLRTGADC